MKTDIARGGIQNPGPLRLSSTLKAFFGISAVGGFIAFGAAAALEPTRAWPNFLLNYFFFLMLGLSGAFFTALQHVTNAYWSTTIRRLSEGMMSYLPVALVLGLALIFLGKGYLYEWVHHEEVAKDHILQLKQAYLNPTFFVIRYFLFFAIWIGLGFKMRSNSLLQDVTGDEKLTLANVKVGSVFLPFFAISMSLMSFDLLMSLEPHWFSTMYGVYAFSGLFFSGLALLAVLMVWAKRQGVLSDQLINENHLHDVGKLMFGFTVFWGYIMFSQLMLQWYANLPEETSYYIRRFHGGWWNFAIFLFVAHFVIPFFGLLPREVKRCESYLSKMALFMLFAQWLDAYMLVMPVFFKEGPVFGWIEAGTFLGFLGVFGLSLAWFYEKVPAIPFKDPRLLDCIAHTQ